MEKDYFNKYTEELNKLYERDPAKAVDYLSDSINHLKSKGFFGTLNYKQKETMIVVLLCVLIALCGLICFDSGIYFGGFIFFISGLLASLYYPKIGVVVLFTHGLLGYILMNSNIFGLIRDNYNMFEGLELANSVNMYLSIFLLTSLTAFVLAVLHSLLKSFEKKKYLIPFILFLFLVSIIVIRIVPYKFGLIETLFG